MDVVSVFVSLIIFGGHPRVHISNQPISVLGIKNKHTFVR
jgi:hypothetical protein